MKRTRKLASTAKKCAKISMAAMAAAVFHQAEADMKAEFGEDYIPMERTTVAYTWNLEGMIA